MSKIVRGLVAVGLAVAFAMGAIVGAEHTAIGQRSATARPRDLGRSVIVYPPQQIALRMNHSHPAHSGLACTQCHSRAAASGRSEDLLIPEERTCVPCHAERIDRSTQTAATCGYCHLGFEGSEGDAGPSPAVPASVMPRPRLHFSHATHVERGQACESCHSDVREARLATRRHLPTMRDCFRCHAPNGLGEGIASHPLTCDACHVSNGAGQLLTRFAEGEMNPPRWMAGMRHDHEWLVRHRWVAADQGSLCAQCHTESDCVACHDSRVRPRSVHPGDFLTTHPVMARRDTSSPGAGRCASCHTVTQFCAECHGRLGIAPIAAPDVRTAERWHPPPGVWTSGPNIHAIEATRSMQSCASCHAEEDCVVCHGSLGVGAGRSPHPPGFADHCRSALETNARACITCHGDVEDLRSRCR